MAEHLLRLPLIPALARIALSRLMNAVLIWRNARIRPIDLAQDPRLFDQSLKDALERS
jgi:hypothetical protein